MPRPPGMDLGPAPPDAPRTLPMGFEFRQKWSRNVGVLVGLGFMFIGGFMLAVLIKVKTWAAVVPGMFFLIGFFLFRYGKKIGVNTVRAFRHGIATEGKVASINLDTTQSVNGRHPWRLVYHFTADGEEREGILTSFDSTLAGRSTGQPLWVLYLRDDPEQCTIYPPLK